MYSEILYISSGVRKVKKFYKKIRKKIKYFKDIIYECLKKLLNSVVELIYFFLLQ